MFTEQDRKRYHQVRGLFENSLDLPEHDREAYLHEETQGDQNLINEVAYLLAETNTSDSPIQVTLNKMVWPALASLNDKPEQYEAFLQEQIDGDVLQADRLIGTTVSHFKIRSIIGVGGMGRVYRATDLKLDREVALKFLPPAVSSDSLAKERFVHEAKIVSGIEHPNIATVHEIGETQDHQLFIAMGYYPGQTLKESIRQGPIPLEESIDYAIQLANALVEVHKREVIHRDIKPGNLLLTSNNILKLLDFGVAKLTYSSGLTQVGDLVGTVAYMSPEQIAGNEVDLRTDIWSAGVVLYELLCGHRPFKGADVQSTIHKILNEQPSAPVLSDREIPKSLKIILGRCLAKDPNLRYNDASELLNELKHVQSGVAPMDTRGLSTWENPKKKQKRIIWIASIGLAALIAALYVPSRSNKSEAPIVSSDPSEIAPCLAILPFENRLPNEEDEFLVYGIQDEILGRVSALEDLDVISPYAIESFLAEGGSKSSLREKLKATAVLEGAVERYTDELKVNVALSDTRIGEVLWTGSFRRRLSAGNLYAVYYEISNSIVEVLKVAVSVQEEKMLKKASTATYEALAALYRGRESMGRQSVEGFLEGIDWFEKAIEADPNFSPAYASIGLAHLGLIWAGGYPRLEQANKAEPYILRAIELGTTELDVFTELAQIREIKGDIQGAEEAFQEAFNRDPYSRWILRSYLPFSQWSSRNAKALHDILDTFFQRNILSEENRDLYVAKLQTEGNFSEAAKLQRKIINDEPNSPNSWYTLANIYKDGMGEIPEAVQAYLQVYKFTPENPWVSINLSGCHASLENYEHAITWIDRAIQVAQDPEIKTYCELERFKLLGDERSAKETAFEALNAFPKSRLFLLPLANWDLASGTPQASLSRFNTTYPELFNSDTEITPSNNRFALFVAELLVAAGKTSEGQQLARKVERTFELVWPSVPLKLDKARTKLVLNETDAAIREVEDYLNGGGYIHEIRDIPVLLPLLKDERLQETIIRNQEKIKEARRELSLSSSTSLKI